MLVGMGIPHEWEQMYDGYHIGYPTLGQNKIICSVIEHKYSHGANLDLLEIMGLLTDKERLFDEVLGGLTADEVFQRIMQDYGKRHG